MSFRAVVKKIIPGKLFDLVEPFGHWLEAVIAQIRYGFPAQKLEVIGVTGTDGKTSTCSLIANMLRKSGYKVAMMTTISVDYGDGKGEQPNPTRLTTVGAMALAKTLKQVKNSGAEWLVLETTSHALAQNRVWGVPFTMAVMTNVTHEHLDYHGTIEKYLEAKRKLFIKCNKNIRGLKVGIANYDDPNGKLFADSTDNPLLYGINGGDLKASHIKLTPKGSKYLAEIENEEYQIVCNLPGSFNVSNSLAAVAVGHALGLTKEQIENGISSLKSVEGRMTRIDEGQDFDVIVDYAHTPVSFKKIFEEVKPLVKGRLIAVFGSAGRRDELKRPKQGNVAGQYCDVVIITEEDDRDCDGIAILEEIAAGAQHAGKTRDKDLFLIHKREDAIQKAFETAEQGDMVLLLGKGHEKSILTNGPSGIGSQIKRPYDEVSVAHTLLDNLN